MGIILPGCTRLVNLIARYGGKVAATRKFHLPATWHQILQAARLQVRAKGTVSQIALARDCRVGVDLARSAYQTGWRDIEGAPLPWAPPIKDVLAAEELLGRELLADSRTGLLEPLPDLDHTRATELTSQARNRFAPPHPVDKGLEHYASITPEHAARVVEAAEREFERQLELVRDAKLGALAVVKAASGPTVVLLERVGRAVTAKLELVDDADLDTKDTLRVVRAMAEVASKFATAAKAAADTEVQVRQQDPKGGQVANEQLTEGEALDQLQQAADLLRRRTELAVAEDPDQGPGVH